MTSANLKYMLIEDKKKKIFQIKALKSFELVNGTVIKKGELGGFVESERSLSQMGNCWVDKDSIIDLKAQIAGNTLVSSSKVLGEVYITGDSIIINSEINGPASDEPDLEISSSIISNSIFATGGTFSYMSITSSNFQVKNGDITLSQNKLTKANITNMSDFEVLSFMNKESSKLIIYKNKASKTIISIEFGGSSNIVFSPANAKRIKALIFELVGISKLQETIIRNNKVIDSLIKYMFDCIKFPQKAITCFMNFLKKEFPEINKFGDINDSLENSQIFQCYLCLAFCFFVATQLKRYIKDRDDKTIYWFYENSNINLKTKGIIDSYSIIYPVGFLCAVKRFYCQNTDLDKKSTSEMFNTIIDKITRKSSTLKTLKIPEDDEPLMFCLF